MVFFLILSTLYMNDTFRYNGLSVILYCDIIFFPGGFALAVLYSTGSMCLAVAFLFYE